MKNIYLHIGRGKTGTTAIQAFMADRIELLKQDGIHYVRASGGQQGVGHQQFAKSFIRDVPDYMVPPVNPANVQNEVAQELLNSTSQNIVMSSENFPLADPNAVIKFLRDLPFETEIKIILFARSQDELLESEYNQMVKVKNVTKSVLSYFDQDFLGADFYEEAKKWEKAIGLPNVICQIYDGKQINVIEQFLNCLPGRLVHTTNDPIKISVQTENRSLGILALETAKLLNTIPTSDHKTNTQFLMEKFGNNDLPAVLFNAETAQRIRNQFDESNRKFLKQYFDRQDSDLGGRRYSDDDRNKWVDRINNILPN